jgi:hypothetical protein
MRRTDHYQTDKLISFWFFSVSPTLILVLILYIKVYSNVHVWPKCHTCSLLIISSLVIFFVCYTRFQICEILPQHNLQIHAVIMMDNAP